MDVAKDVARRSQRRLGPLLTAAALLVLLIATRATHLRGPIDDPHSWRQCDTAQYAHAFYRDGVSLLKPSVCWMGGQKTTVLEFPFPEMLMAWAYHAFGYHLFVARLVTLAFFTGSALYLFLIVRHVADGRLAAIAAGVYMILPLSQFYSRAIHIDFFAVFFAHAMAFHLLRAFSRPRLADVGLAGVAGCLAFLIKAPYAFYFALPLLCIAAVQTRPWRCVALLGGVMLAGALSFAWWRWHGETVNAAAPDWSFIPGYMKFVDMDDWYFGPLQMRLDANVWGRVLERFRQDVTSTVGAWLFLAGAVVSLAMTVRGRRRQVLPLWAWMAGVLAYVVVFLNLNYRHSYYQIPLLAVTAVFIALAVDAPRHLLGGRHRLTAGILSLAMFAAVTLAATAFAQRQYYETDPVREEAGRVIERVTPIDALVVAAPSLRGTDCRDPRLLFRARRMGWSIYKRDLSRQLLERLRAEGATHLATVERTPDDLTRVYGYPAVAYPIDQGRWTVLIATLANDAHPDQRP